MTSLIHDKRIDVWSFKPVPVTVCMWEVLAVTTKKIPTLTRLMHEHPWLKPIFVGTLAWHLLNEKE